MGKKKKGDGAAKTAAKTAKAELKALKKETGEDDIDQLLADLRVRDAAQTAISITACEMPTPRSSATWLPHPTKDIIILFGGEFYDGRITSVYNDCTNTDHQLPARLSAELLLLSGGLTSLGGLRVSLCDSGVRSFVVCF
jgi:hypothetical protein